MKNKSSEVNAIEISKKEIFNQQNIAQKKVYFSGLNSLRFIAACVVIIHHVEQLKSLYSYSNYFDTVFVHNIGSYGVTFFFALSGFLITYLLLVEQKILNVIDVQKFYIRRALRIWPLYYLLGILSLIVLPHIQVLNIPVWQDELDKNCLTQIILYLTFLPNIAINFFGLIPHANQVWSIGVEEQFYLLWPLVVKYSRNIWNAIFKVMGFYLIIKLIMIAVLEIYADNPDTSAKFFPWSQLINYTRIDCMAIGAIGAAYLFYNPQALKPFYSSFSQYFLYIVSLLFLAVGGISGTVLWHFNQEIFAALSTLIVLNIATNPTSIFQLKNKTLDYLGKISYGLYMYHCLCIAIAFYLVNQFTSYSISGLTGNLIAYTLSFALTILVSALSYHWIEQPFIRQKYKFARVASGDSPN